MVLFFFLNSFVNVICFFICLVSHRGKANNALSTSTQMMCINLIQSGWSLTIDTHTRVFYIAHFHLNILQDLFTEVYIYLLPFFFDWLVPFHLVISAHIPSSSSSFFFCLFFIYLKKPCGAFLNAFRSSWFYFVFLPFFDNENST